MGHDEQKKTAIIIVGFILLVAMVVAIVIVSDDSGGKKKAKVLASAKAVTAICQTTDYQKPCFDSLQGQNSTDAKELIQVAMQATIAHINDALQNSTLLRQIQTDPRTKSALDTCTELSNRATYDLQRSLSKFKEFDITNVDDILLELKTWISGAMTHQETCLDGFENLKGDAGERMRKILTKSMQMTSNALAMVAEISTFLESMGVQGYKKSSHSSRRRRRRLLSNDQDLPGSSWVNEEKRRLLQVHTVKIKPNIIVAKDGSGKYKTINEAVKHIPKYNNKTFVLYIKQGVYEEHVLIETPFTKVMMIGDGPTKTRITGRLNFVDGVGTYQSATVAVHGDDFIARDIGFENSAGAEKSQAVALRASADKMMFFNCHIEGYQDTLYTHAYRQFYRDCLISGTVDFIVGDSAAIFQGCTLLFRKPLKDQQNIVTAQGRMDLRQPTALVLQNCTFKADPEVQQQVRSYLGRPWKEYSRTIIMESFLDDFIHPDGWMAPDNKSTTLQTVFYTEFNNRGPASPKAQRVKWPGVKELPPSRIKRFTAAEFLDGNRWISRRTVHYAAGFIFPVPKKDPNIKYSPVSTEETKDLGSSAEKKNTESNDNKSETESPPPIPKPQAPTTVPPASAPQSNIAAQPTMSQHGAVVGAAAPAPVGGFDMETGDLVIDLSPNPAPVPAPAASGISGPPFLSPDASADLTPSPSTTQALSPQRGGPASSGLRPNGSPTSTPTLNAAASPTISPSGGSDPTPSASSSSQIARAPSFTGAE